MKVAEVAPMMLVKMPPVPCCHWKLNAPSPSRSAILPVSAVNVCPRAGVVSLISTAPVGASLALATGSRMSEAMLSCTPMSST
ncbi:hypothetical protein D3C81_1046790 [compost metagenome]